MASGNLDIPQAAQSMGYVPFHGVDGCQRHGLVNSVDFVFVYQFV